MLTKLFVSYQIFYKLKYTLL